MRVNTKTRESQRPKDVDNFRDLPLPLTGFHSESPLTRFQQREQRMILQHTVPETKLFDEPMPGDGGTSSWIFDGF